MKHYPLLIATLFLLCQACATGLDLDALDPPLRTIHQGDAAQQGEPNAPVVIVEFSLLANTQNKKLHNSIRELHKKHPGKIRHIFKNVIAACRTNTAPAVAKACMAAQEQGAFWQYAEKLAASKNLQSEAELFEVAQKAGLDEAQFQSDASSRLFKVRTDANAGLATKLNLPKGAGILINGRVLPLQTSANDLESVVAEELARGKRLQEAGIPTEQIALLLTDLNQTIRRSESTPVQKSATPSGKRFPVGYSRAHLDFGVSEKEALVTLVVFNDYQCPFCKRHEETLQALLKEFPKQLRIVVRHNPLAMHKEAKLAAQASLTAVEFGAGGTVHNELFANMRALNRAEFLRIGAEQGLDPLLFEAGFERNAALVEEDLRDAKKYGVRGTPYTFINGTLVRGAKKLDFFRKAIRAEMRRATQIQSQTKLSGRPLYNELIQD